ncbi:MAG: L-2-amino-thiazoline-4-carboxylic acid hydrolase [Deltaproteobacteria bacterium]|nr:L-2-amino-thiazoline-4-carboxylic acid hydrolase [Deltaproteobacteria bacterium]
MAKSKRVQPMNRRNFLKATAITAGATVLGGGGLSLVLHDPDSLKDHFESVEKVLSAGLGNNRATGLMMDVHSEQQALAADMPYIGGNKNIFTQWLVYGVYYLAVYRVLKADGNTVGEIGRIVFDAFRKMADYPGWMLYLIGKLKYNRKYIDTLRRSALRSQEKRYPGDWVATFIEGDGESFDYGIDITECGIHKFFQSYGAQEFTPYMCLSDFVVSDVFNRGLIRYETLAEGAARCDFRYKKDRSTFVYPLRDGWPPKFKNTHGLAL